MASSNQRIKGITIEIGGDTTDLQKALKGVNTQISKTSTALKDVNSLLKLDPSNTTLLKQKQELLAKQVESTKEKLAQEKEALEQLKNADNSGETIEQQQALEREIVATTQSLEELEKESKQAGSVLGTQMQQAGEKISAAGDKISGMGEKLLGVTGTVTAIGAASVAAWTEVDDAMDIIVTKTGATGEALQDMEDIATEMAETIPTSFEDAATAVGEVNTRFGVTGDELEDLSTKFVEFATINGTDVNSAIDTVQTALNAFGLSADDAGAMLDTLNTVGQNTGISMDELASLMTSNATAFQGLGLNAADAANLLGTLEKSGIDTSVVMTGLSKVQKDAMENNISMEESLTNALSSSEAAIDTFGSKAGPKLYTSFQNGTLSVSDFVTSTSSLNDALGSVENTYNETLDPLDQMTTVMNTLKDTGADIVNSAAPMLVEVLGQLSTAVQSLNEWYSSLDQGQQEAIIKFALVAAAVGPVLIVIGKLVSGFGSLVTTFGTVITFVQGTLIPGITALATTITGTVIPAVVAFVVANAPVLIAIAAVVAAVVAVIAIIKNWGTISEWFQQKWEALGEKVSAIKDTFLNLVEQAKDWGKDMLENFINGISEKIQKVKDTIGGVAETIASYIHFSEPDVGPLSKFHTFMPDMMKEMANGITSNINLLDKPMNQLAQTMVPTSNSSADLSTLTGLVSQYLPQASQNANVNVVLQGDAAGVFKLVKQQNKSYIKSTGKSAF